MLLEYIGETKQSVQSSYVYCHIKKALFMQYHCSADRLSSCKIEWKTKAVFHDRGANQSRMNTRKSCKQKRNHREKKWTRSFFLLIRYQEQHYVNSPIGDGEHLTTWCQTRPAFQSAFRAAELSDEFDTNTITLGEHTFKDISLEHKLWKVTCMK